MWLVGFGIGLASAAPGEQATGALLAGDRIEPVVAPVAVDVQEPGA